METEVLEVVREEREAEQKVDGGGFAETDTSTDTEIYRYPFFPSVPDVTTETYKVQIFPFIRDPRSDENSGAVDSNELQYFAQVALKDPILADLVADALSFEKLFGSHKFWFCHLCRSYFSTPDSLTMHLKVEHIPSWPRLLKQDQEFVRESICKIVWKPIHVERALRLFYTLCLDANLEAVAVSPTEVQWPWSDDDSDRIKLVSELGQELNAMASDKNGLPFLSSGTLRYLIFVASRYILSRLHPNDLVLDFTRLLASSLLTFCFLEKESLCCFVKVVKSMRQIVQNETSVCDNMSDDSTNYTLTFIPPYTDLFVLEPANCKDKWLGQKPSNIPCNGPLQLSSGRPEFLMQITNIAEICCNLIKIMGERISCFNVTDVTEFFPKAFYEADVHSLTVVEELCMLQNLEFEVCRLCTFDFRSYIVPLMQRFLQRCSSSSSNEEKFTAGFGYSDTSSCSFSGFDSTDDSTSSDNNNSGLFICLYVADVWRDIQGIYTENLFSEAISHMRIHKTWSYWFCYCCQKRFPDRESHMMHMDNKHELKLHCDEQSRLIPQSPSKHEVDRLLGLERIGDHTEEYAILNRMKELLYSVVEDKAVPFSGSSHLVHVAEFARDAFLRTASSDEKKLLVAREIDENAQLVFSMYNAPCLLHVEKFLENLCKGCTALEMQTHEPNVFPHFGSSGISYAGCNKLQVDVAKFAETFPLAQKEVEERDEHPFASKFETYWEIRECLVRELQRLEGCFDAKRQVLSKLDVVFALDHMLIRESDHVGTLRSRYEKLDSLYLATKGNFQHQLISQLLGKASSLSIEEALRNEKDELLSKLGFLDVDIMQMLAQINKMRREISDICFWDYSSDILPVIGVFLKPRIRADICLVLWTNHKLRDLLSSIDHSDLSIKSVSIGEVFVNIMDKWGLHFDYNRIRLNFEVLKGKRSDGYVDFLGSSDWFGLKNEDRKGEATIIDIHAELFPELAASLSKAVSAKLLKFQELFIEKCCLPFDGNTLCYHYLLDERNWQRENFDVIEEE